jgi:hypothetical protein
LDISAMELGDTLKVGDLPAIEGVEYLDDVGASIVTVIIPRIVEVEVPEEVEGEELPEGEEAPEGAEAAAEPEAESSEEG